MTPPPSSRRIQRTQNARPSRERVFPRHRRRFHPWHQTGRPDRWRLAVELHLLALACGRRPHRRHQAFRRPAARGKIAGCPRIGPGSSREEFEPGRLRCGRGMAVEHRLPISTPDDSRVECRRHGGLRPGQTEVLRVVQVLQVVQVLRECLDHNQELVGQ